MPDTPTPRPISETFGAVPSGPPPGQSSAEQETVAAGPANVASTLAEPRAAEPGMAATTVVSTAALGASRVAGWREHFEGPGSVIGPYTLREQLGEGGFGSVFRAEQAKPVKREVALKIIKLGMDTRQVVARFEQERQALAVMNHPNIARVIDAGSTQTGRPFFVMELVKGEPLTAFCDRHQLSIQKRLALFIQVCNAVQHAHHKGVIHRDIKPSNVLAGTMDGKPFVKVIDFGIAKATDARLTEKTLLTEHKALIGTPEYMSPEQAEGSIDIDTRTDVYSLGVLLYELLTGATPFDSKRLRSAAYGEIQRIIREDEPPIPSKRASSWGAAPAKGTAKDSAAATAPTSAQSAAAARGTEARKLPSMLRGELDWIVMRALEKDRGRRYETANALGMDVDRHLKGEAVVAAPPSFRYRIWKLARKNKQVRVALAGSMAVALLTVVATLGSLVLQTEGALTRERASREQTLELLGNFTVAFHSLRRDQTGNLTDKAIAEAAAPILEATKKFPPNDLELRQRASRTLEAIAQAAGGSSLGSASRHEASRPIVERALEMRRELAAAKPSSVLAKAGLAQCTILAGDLAREMQMTENAQRYYAEAESVTREFIKDSPECKRMYAISLAKLASFAAGSERERLLGDSIKLRRELASSGGKFEYMIDLSNALFALGNVREDAEDFHSAIRLHKDSLESRLRVYEKARTWETRVDVMRSNVTLARLQSRGETPSRKEKFDDFKEAEARIVEAVNFAKQIENEFGASNLPDKVRQSVMNAYTNGAVLYTKLGKSKEASTNVEDAWRVATAMKTKVKNDITSFMDLADAALSVSQVALEDIQSVGLLYKSKELYEILKANGATLDKVSEQNYQNVLDAINAFNGVAEPAPPIPPVPARKRGPSPTPVADPRDIESVEPSPIIDP